MATALAVDADSGDLRVGAWSVDSGTHEIIAAVGHLAGADDVLLLALDSAEHTLDVASMRGDHRASAAVRNMVVAQSYLMFAPARAQWVPDEGTASSESLVIRVGDFNGKLAFLALRFSDARLLRERVTRIAPDLLVLVKHHLESIAKIDGAHVNVDAAVAVLDHETCGIILVRADHSIVMTNEAARAGLDDRWGLHLRRNAIRAKNYHDSIRFQEALDRVIDPPFAEKGGKACAIALLLTASKGERPPIVVIAPLPPGDAQGTTLRDAAAVIYVLQPVQKASADGLHTVCKLHNLSRVEAKLMAHLLNGATITDAATEMRIKVETARAYLKQVFAKTGVHRQTDLIALMSSYLGALRGNFDFRPV